MHGSCQLDCKSLEELLKKDENWNQNLDLLTRILTSSILLVALTLIESANLEVSGDVSSTTKTFQLGGQAREPPPRGPHLRPQSVLEANPKSRDASNSPASLLRI